MGEDLLNVEPLSGQVLRKYCHILSLGFHSPGAAILPQFSCPKALWACQSDESWGLKSFRWGQTQEVKEHSLR